MGFDISYHPISEEEIHDWYFAALADIKNGNKAKVRALARSYAIDEFYIDRYLEILDQARRFKPKDHFEKTHGFCIAVVQGFFRTYYYVRGSAFSFLIEKDATFRKYTKPWEEILQVPLSNPIKNQIVENYCSGVYLPYDKLLQLYDDYENKPEIRKVMDEVFSDDRILVFLKAVSFAVENRLGILEATEVIEPQPFDLNNSNSYSNLFNCDIEGALLYQKAALEDISQIM